jgi:predicted signal transduction protein with EAL and GGDEF domain
VSAAAGVLAAVVLAVGLAVAAVSLVRNARRRRTRDLRTLGVVGSSIAAHAVARRTDDGRVAAREIAEALRLRYGARRVVLTVGPLRERAGEPPAGGEPGAPAEAFRAGRGASRWHRRTAPAAVGCWMAAADATEVLVAPIAAPEVGEAAEAGAVPEVVRSRHGVLEVHDPSRIGAQCWRGPTRSVVRGELALLATVARQVGAEVENSRLEARLRRDAHRDPLTTLLNRPGFLQAAADEVQGGSGAIAVVSFGLLDQVNDTLGHARGDEFVALAARRLAAVCASERAAEVAPGARLAARLEGDTYAVVVAGVDGPAAHASAQEMREHLVRPFVVEGIPFEAPVLVGVAVAGTPALAAEVDGAVVASRLLARADIALSAARLGGSSPVRCYEPRMGERADRRLALIRGFAPAVADGSLRVHYQPTVSLEARTVLGVEALARWEHPDLGALLPDEFVPVLEATGQIAGLTAFVLDEALAAARRWLDRGLRLSVAVNVSVGSLDDSFPPLVAEALARHGVPADMLTLEVTEGGVSAEREHAMPALRLLHVMGCRLAVDDFGTGQSSLAHLRHLPVDQVKIDKSFVLGMGTETGDAAVVRAIVEMGHTLGLTVVAEGVEDCAVRTALAEMGCDVAQGYLVSRPLSAGHLDQWLDSLARDGGATSGVDGPCVRWRPPAGTAPESSGAA